jgi:hypothetical protein
MLNLSKNCHQSAQPRFALDAKKPAPVKITFAIERKFL